MELLVNDNSLHGQFQDIHSFEIAVDHLMTMRNKSRQYGRELYCHRNMAHSDVTFDMNMRQAVNRFDRSKQRVLMQWFAQQGPFWDDDRIHESDDYLECHEQIVTDTALGEAAIRRLHSRDCRVISLKPSDWEFTPLSVFWKSSDIDETGIDIPNYWEMPPLESALREAPEPVSSWEAMAKICKRRFSDLSFSTDAFDPLKGHPFNFGCAQRIMERLEILNRFKTCFDETGTRTDEGQRLYQEYFTGKKAWFTDSSDSEKNKFKSQLTFQHPDVAGEDLICTWHGKVKTPQIRIHFSWPVSADTPLYIVYVGPKITKK